MKKALYLLTAMCIKILPAFAQDFKLNQKPGSQKPNFTISGKIGHLNKPAKVYLEYRSDEKSITDSCDLVDGVFRFSGYLTDITYSRMTLSRDGQKDKEIFGNKAGDVIYPYFGKENIRISSKDSLYNAKWTGSAVHNDMLAFEKQVGDDVMTINHNLAVLYNHLAPEQRTGPASAYQQAADRLFDDFKNTRPKRLLNFAKNNTSSFFALQALTNAVDTHLLEPEEAMAVFTRLSKALRTSKAGKALQQQLEELQIESGLDKAMSGKIPPKTWNEHWFEHAQNVDLVYYDNHVAFYYDNQMDKSVTWPFKTMSDAWKYVKKTYGPIGDSSRLYVIFHQDRYFGGHPGYYYDAGHDFRNTLDCGLGDWTNPTSQQIGMPLHEIGHIVCSSTNGVQGAPSDALWGDSKFMEIFVYDILLNIGRQDEAAKVYEQMENKDPNEDYPGRRYPGVRWFMDWFYPIYSQYGKGALLGRYFKVIADNYPRSHGNVLDESKEMNLGEFVHFWSGAAKADLSKQAKLAWGKYWTQEVELQLLKARTDFPKVKYIVIESE